MADSCRVRAERRRSLRMSALASTEVAAATEAARVASKTLSWPERGASAALRSVSRAGDSNRAAVSDIMEDEVHRLELEEQQLAPLRVWSKDLAEKGFSWFERVYFFQ